MTTVVGWHRIPGGYLSDQITEEWPGEVFKGEAYEPETQIWQYRTRRAKKFWDNGRWRQHWVMTSSRDGKQFPAWNEEWNFDAFSTLAKVKADVQAKVDRAIGHGAKVTLSYEAKEEER